MFMTLRSITADRHAVVRPNHVYRTASRPRAILFDLDDTLLESTRGIHLWQDELVDEHGWGSAGRQFMRLQHESPDPPTVTFGKIVDHFGLDHSAEDLRARFLERWPSLVAPVTSAMDVLIDLRSRQWKLGLVTNGSAELQTAKTPPDMLALFDAVCFAGEGRVPAKPDPRPFLQVAAMLEVDASECWMVGDSLATDVEGARRAGMRPIWVTGRPEDRARGAVDSIDSLADLVDLVGSARDQGGRESSDSISGPQQ
jgi:putative hydrolase of the HAD superfamily